MKVIVSEPELIKLCVIWQCVWFWFLTHTADSCRVELKVGGAVTDVAPWSVHAKPADTCGGVSALVYI